MGYGQEEPWEWEDEWEPEPDEELAMRVFEYDGDEWLALSHKQKEQKIKLAKMMEPKQ